MVSIAGESKNFPKKYIVIAVIAGLFIGSIGAFGVFNQVIETPLQQTNEDLKAELARLELDRSSHEQSISGYVNQIELPRSQLEPTGANNAATAKELQLKLEATEASNAATIEELQLKLEKRSAQYQSALKSLKRERQRNRQTGDGWSGKYN